VGAIGEPKREILIPTPDETTPVFVPESAPAPVTPPETPEPPEPRLPDPGVPTPSLPVPAGG
jgi:hypothetical protein